MVTKDEVKKLAALARISIADSDLEKFTQEFDSVLNYVGQLESLIIPSDLANDKPLLRNVMRTDGTPIKSGTYSKKLIAQFPDRDGDLLLVKKIISHD